MSFTALFGGTFNPLHIGHCEILAALENRPEIGEIWIMPTRIPPHKVFDKVADDSVRIEMCRMAAKHYKKAQVSLIEFERTGKSYTFDTVKLLKQKYPERDFVFVCGGDMLVTFDEWYRYSELMKMLPFYAFRRTDTDDTLFDSKKAQLEREGMRITVMNERITAVSSTLIRKDVNSAKALLPEYIYDYIKAGGIYGV